jgi:serine/threonine protein kinase
MTDIWSKWESLVVNGAFPLRRFLGSSDHSVVFLTEYAALNIPDAAIKFIPADPARADAQISHWRTVATLSHPHLIRLFEVGRCELGGYPFLFVVMEWADQTLAQVLPQRALTPDELRELLRPSLGALALLHRQQLVHGALKPPNFLVINDQLKLASDNVRRAGESVASTTKPSLYDAPEARDVGLSAAGDVWALGITMVEALTQTPPAWANERAQTVALPTTLAPEFADTIRRCLSRDPASRPGITDLEAAMNLAPQALVISASPADAPQSPVTGRSEHIRKLSDRRPFIGAAVAVAFLALVAAWTGMRLLRTQPSVQPTVLNTSEPSHQQATGAGPAPAPQSTSTPAPASSAVLHQEIPIVPRGARDSIRGRIKVTVRVVVDHSGHVVSETHLGASKYFARLAGAAARKWQFAPDANAASRVWLLRFEFTRAGTTAHADAVRS